MTPPTDPVAAATHPDPYPYYDALVRERPFGRDEALGMHVAAGAEAVGAVLRSPAMRVRPPGEPVPRAIAGTPAGEIFGRLVRMSDRPAHAPRKRAVSAMLDGLDTARIPRLAGGIARELAADRHLAEDPARIAPFAFRLTAHVTSALLGLPERDRDEAADLTGELVAGLSPLATAEEIARSNDAASRLIGLATRMGGAPELGERGVTDANAIGLLVQGYEATAGLIGNALVALARGSSGPLGEHVRRTALLDPAVQNTRRWVAEPCRIVDRELFPGDAVLVLLAAANRDPRAGESLSFGVGAHACPGQAIAFAVAEAGLAAILEAGVDPVRAARERRYRRSVNLRLPLFGATKPGGARASWSCRG